MSPQKAHREPGYDPRKIFDYWFCRGVQSAIFHYASCTDWKNYKAAKQRRKQAEKSAKQRAAEQAIITEQPRLIPQMQPLPSETNKGWTAEINMGRKYDPRQNMDRRVSSGNAPAQAHIDDGHSYEYYRAKKPEIDDQCPPIVCRLPPAERKHEVAWIKLPPASRAVMEGREVPDETAPPRRPLGVIEPTKEEYYAWLHKTKRTSGELRASPPDSKKEKKEPLEHHFQWGDGQQDEKMSHSQKPEEAHTKSSGLSEEQHTDVDYGTYRSMVQPAPPTNHRDDTSIGPATPVRFFDEHISKPHITNHQRRHQQTSSESSGWVSTWDSEPDAYKIINPRKQQYLVHSSGARRGKPRINSLVLVHHREKSEIRGASYTYDSFWNDQAHST